MSFNEINVLLCMNSIFGPKGFVNITVSKAVHMKNVCFRCYQYVKYACFSVCVLSISLGTAWCTFIIGLDHSANIFGKITVGGSSAAGVPSNLQRELNQ